MAVVDDAHWMMINLTDTFASDLKVSKPNFLASYDTAILEATLLGGKNLSTQARKLRLKYVVEELVLSWKLLRSGDAVRVLEIALEVSLVLALVQLTVLLVELRKVFSDLSSTRWSLALAEC